MKPTFFIALGLLCASVSAYAANDALSPATTEVIEIPVSAKELDDCRTTLAEVAAMPARYDNGTPIFLDWGQSELPEVRCVVAET